ncbi:MAG: hypothetical protein N2Z20_04140 [Elusimicrobiales bacterium]|nr:hypothetical protein [Elusimicrobiales bacterium]
MIFISLLFSSMLMTQLIPDVVISTQDISEKKIYKPYNLRNPMIRPTTFSPTTLNYSYKYSTSTLSDVVFNMDSLVLEGIMSTSKFKEALLRDVSSGEMYIIRDGKIYTLNRRVINGYSVDIVGKGVIIKDKKSGKKIELIISEQGEKL